MVFTELNVPLLIRRKLRKIGDTFYPSKTLCRYDSPMFGEEINYMPNRDWNRPVIQADLK